MKVDIPLHKETVLNIFNLSSNIECYCILVNYIILYLFYNSDGMKKRQILQFVNKKNYTNWYRGKIP